MCEFYKNLCDRIQNKLLQLKIQIRFKQISQHIFKSNFFRLIAALPKAHE